jgi:hypothetical protein
MNETTTDLAKLKASRSARFTWGRVIKIHEIGFISLVEFRANSDAVIRFHVYQNGIDTCVSASSLEEGVIVSLAYAHKDPGAATYIMRILGEPHAS